MLGVQTRKKERQKKKKRVGWDSGDAE